MPIIPAGYAQVNLKFGGAALPFGAECTFGVANGTSLTAEEIFDFVAAEVVPLIEATMVETAQLNSILVKLGPNATGAFHEGALTIPGDQALDATPTQVSINVIKGSASGGRQNRGRMFWPAAPENVIATDGTWDTGALVQFNGAFSDFALALAGDDIPMVILHNSVSTPTVVTSLEVGARTVTQRRRNRSR